MTSSIPNSFSSDDLSKLLKSAPKEAEVHSDDDCGCDCCNDIDAMEELADQMLNSIAKTEFSAPVVHKVIAMKVIARMIEWHTTMGVEMFKDGDVDCGTSWLRDAGKFQSMFNELISISVGRDDYTCALNEDDEE